MTTPPYTADKAEEMNHLFVDLFETLNDDISPLLQKLNELKTPERYTVNTQIEQVQFKDLAASAIISAMVEQVQLNEHDKEQTLLLGVINDLVRRMQGRQRLPFSSIRHFRNFAGPQNTIKVRVQGLPFTAGVESFAYLLMADRLMDLRPSYREVLGHNVTFDREGAEDARNKSLSDEDVWYSHIELNDDQSIVMHFIVLTFDVREKMKDYQDGGIRSN